MKKYEFVSAHILSVLLYYKTGALANTCLPLSLLFC